MRSIDGGGHLGSITSVDLGERKGCGDHLGSLMSVDIGERKGPSGHLRSLMSVDLLGERKGRRNGG